MATTRGIALRGYHPEASVWGWLALAAATVSVAGYLTQIALDHTPPVGIIDNAVFFGLFEGTGLLGLATGLVALATGWKRSDSTMRFGIIAVAWVILAQTIQSLWD